MNIELNGFNFKFGNFGNPIGGIGAFINFEDDKIKKAVSSGDDDLYSAICELLQCGEELDALYTITNFENYELQGHGWDSMQEHCSFKTLEEYKRKATVVLNSKKADADQLATAKTIISILDGNYIRPTPPEKSPEEKRKALFEKKKPKLRLSLVIRDGYKCVDCSGSQEGSLCIVQKNVDLDNYEVDNLVLKCRKCMKKK